MSTGADEVIQKIQTKIQADNRAYSDWYVGIAKEIQKTLFEKHRVSEQNGKWIYFISDSPSEAVKIRDVLVQQGVTNIPQNDDLLGLVVFAYQTTPTTKQ